MRIFTGLVLTLGFALLQTQASFAANSMTGGGMKMAKCAANNPAVIMNTTKKTYMLDTKASRNSMIGMMGHDKFICRSQAEKMGGKLKGASAKMNKMNKM